MPFNPDDYERDGLRLGSPTEVQLLRLNERWATRCPLPKPLNNAKL